MFRSSLALPVCFVLIWAGGARAQQPGPLASGKIIFLNKNARTIQIAPIFIVPEPPGPPGSMPSSLMGQVSGKTTIHKVTIENGKQVSKEAKWEDLQGNLFIMFKPGANIYKLDKGFPAIDMVIILPEEK